MSDVMLYGVLRMPYEMAMSSEIARYQFYQRAREAADRLEAAEAKVEALTVPQWISVEDQLPEDRQDVTFVVRASGPFEYLNGRVLAGTFIASYCGDFSVPGLTVGASYWMPSPAAPTIPAIPGTKEDA